MIIPMLLMEEIRPFTAKIDSINLGGGFNLFKNMLVKLDHFPRFSG